MDLTTVQQIRNQFLRLTGTNATDQGLTNLGEAPNEVVDTYLTRGVRDAQEWMLYCGYYGWKRMSDPLVFTRQDNVLVAPLPADFLRAVGSERPGYSALRDRLGRPWGREVNAADAPVWGNVRMVAPVDRYWIEDVDNVKIPVLAQPPQQLQIEYHYMHPSWDDDVVIDFPRRARGLIAAEAAYLAKEENWLPGAQDMEQKIDRARFAAREEARKVSRTTKTPRRLRRRVGFGTKF